MTLTHHTQDNSTTTSDSAIIANELTDNTNIKESNKRRREIRQINDEDTTDQIAAEAPDNRGPDSADVTSQPELSNNPRYPAAPTASGTHKGLRTRSPPSPDKPQDSRGPAGAEVKSIPEPADNPRHLGFAGRGTQKDENIYSPKDSKGAHNTMHFTDPVELRSRRGPVSAEAFFSPEPTANPLPSDAAGRGTDKRDSPYSPKDNAGTKTLHKDWKRVERKPRTPPPGYREIQDIG